MKDNNPFEKVGRFLIQLALLIILIAGLIRIIALEVKSVRGIFAGDKQTNERVESPAEIQGR